MSDLTPMAKQYQEIKSSCRDAILFFRLGDFYEMFNEDAELASRELDLTLTGRGKEENRMPMCGLPYHAADGYIEKLINKGYKVAICEQVEDPKTAQGVVKREIIKVITPGTVLDPAMIQERTNNYLAAVSWQKGKYGLAFIDASTGEFKLTDLESCAKLIDEIKRISPAEIIVADLFPEEEKIRIKVLAPASEFKDIYDSEKAEEDLLAHFKATTLGSFGLDRNLAALGGAAAILDYLKQTQKTTLGHIKVAKYYQTGDFMVIDAVTRGNLELTRTIRDKAYKGSLLWVIDKTKTPMGSRLLRQWLLQPLLESKLINQRLDAVEELFKGGLLRLELSEKLKNVFDIERLAGKIASQVANARDLVALKESLKQLPALRNILKECQSAKLKELSLLAGEEEQKIIDLIESAVVDEPPFTIKDGGIIKDGYNIELDEIKKTARGGRGWVAELEAQERRKTGIKSLKVGFTRVFGYYIEITNSNLDQAPPDYIRKQTLVNAERFITPELKEKEVLILKAEERLKEEEYLLFCDIRSTIAQQIRKLQALAAALAEIDVLVSLAESAVANCYCRPLIDDSDVLEAKEARHPVVEKTLADFQFVPNDIKLDKNNFFLLITGPNMGGKSTYMRQAALIAILARIGSFVPAKEARVGLIDRIFTRIGAMDDIYAGQSTFMVEMVETANILHNASANSLIILDEIGRGTSTFDGMSIAAAVAEYIYKNLKAKTLFATHYHEITQLADKHPGMKNFHVLAEEKGDQITFLHQVKEGAASRSYGIQVAKLAGLPAEVVARAKEVYNTLEMVENDLGKTQERRKSSPVKKVKLSGEPRAQASLF